MFRRRRPCVTHGLLDSGNHNQHDHHDASHARHFDYHHGNPLELAFSLSYKLVQAACDPSQNGLLTELPQRHKVSRFRISYVFSSAETTGMPPRTQIGPLTFFSVSSISPSDGSNFGSMGLPVALSQITSRPAGQ